MKRKLRNLEADGVSVGKLVFMLYCIHREHFVLKSLRKFHSCARLVND